MTNLELEDKVKRLEDEAEMLRNLIGYGSCRRFDYRG